MRRNMESDIIRTNTIRIADATERAASALERIASALERFWPVYVTPSPVPNYTPPYIVPAFPFTSPTTQPYVPNNGNTLVLGSAPMRSNGAYLPVSDAGAGPSEPYPTRPAPVDLSGESDLANYRARGYAGEPDPDFHPSNAA
jgi:hypothetical protein